MKTNHLRLGNAVLIDGVKTLITDIHPLRVNTCVLITHVSGIPITPELLQGFGFSKYGNPFRNRHAIHQGDTEKTTQIVDLNENTPSFQLADCVWHDIEYIHQLQNIYFALTGEELKYRTTK